ncbi:GAP family protein [uncultured Agrococcus sp.]|uniref:GAP family protein n=1 Tax=uncultured Agrococcus sp. TaxID=382258 RepID=UPI0025D3719C|nr:GAP family protein [uncultured Agrococcus sp.]
MTPILAAGLVGLALIDSTSVGTLFIPVWLLLASGRVRAGRFAVYLGTIVVFYFAVGIVIALGADVAFSQLAELLADDNDSPAIRITQIVIGVSLFAWGWWLGSKKRRERKRESGRLMQWRERAMTGAGSSAALMTLAILAAVIELASMLPYLAAIGLMTAADIGWIGTGLTLAAYCLLMVLPAVVLIVLRILAHDRVEPVLRRINDWIAKHSDTLLSSALCGIGIYLVLNALAVLFLV